MEWFYYETLNIDSYQIHISGEEFNHIKAHRIKINEKIIVTNGKGLACECDVVEITKTHCLALVSNFVEQNKPNNKDITLAMPILDSRERFEFAFEKAIELGITRFIPLITDYSSKKQPNRERLRAKAISAIKQCQRATLPDISHPIKFEELIKSLKETQFIIVADIFGQKPHLDAVGDDILLLVGPEGGLSEKELIMLRAKPNCVFWNLGDYRLRSETSALVMLGILKCL